LRRNCRAFGKRRGRPFGSHLKQPPRSLDPPRRNIRCEPGSPSGYQQRNDFDGAPKRIALQRPSLAFRLSANPELTSTRTALSFTFSRSRVLPVHRVWSSWRFPNISGPKPPRVSTFLESFGLIRSSDYRAAFSIPPYRSSIRLRMPIGRRAHLRSHNDDLCEIRHK